MSKPGLISPPFPLRKLPPAAAPGPAPGGGGTTPPPGLPALPAWASAIIAGRWANASTNLLTDVQSGLAGSNVRTIIESYNGGVMLSPGAWGTHGGLACFGGGHESVGRDSAVYVVNLGTRAWQRISNPSAGPFNGGGAGTYPTGFFADGYPVPTHTYCYPGFDPGRKLIFLPRGVSSFTASTQDAKLARGSAMDVLTGLWRPTKYNDTFVGRYNNGGRTVWDDRRQCFWTLLCHTSYADRQMVKTASLDVLNADGTYGTVTNYAFNDNTNESDMVLIPGAVADDDLLVWSDFNPTTKRLYASRIVGGVPQPRITLTMGGTPPGVLHKTGALMWSRRRSSIVYYDNRQANRAEVHELVAPANKLTGTWTWAPLLDAGNTVTPGQHVTTSGIYSKARIAEFSDGELLVAAPRHDTPAVAFRIP